MTHSFMPTMPEIGCKRVIDNILEALATLREMTDEQLTKFDRATTHYLRGIYREEDRASYLQQLTTSNSNNLTTMVFVGNLLVLGELKGGRWELRDGRLQRWDFTPLYLV